MSDQVTFLDALVDAIQRAGRYNKNDQVPPIVVLWTDKDRQWEPLLPLLRDRLPLLTLGQYNPGELTGPAYWLRCVIARSLPEPQLPADVTPIIYLPGISKQELRAVEETPKLIQPLAELQYRGVLWNHKNGRDWTVAGFMQSTDGLGIEVGTDNATKEALQRALLKLADEPLARLKKEAPLRAPFFDALLNPDEVRSLLLWLNDSEGYPKRCSAAEWASFCGLSQRKYGFHPVEDGVMVAMALFGEHQGVWGNITALYRPWLEQAATAMQKLVYADHPLKTYHVEPLPEPANGTCILFCDGLRYDTGQRLKEVLEAHKLTGKVEAHLVALPGVTPTAKPAFSPVARMLTGKGSQGLEPIVSASGSKVTADALRKLLVQAGYQVLMGDELGDPSGKAWTEMGAIDSYGHQYGWKLAHHLTGEIRDLVSRIEALINWGWKQVLVITDHGWLLLPGNLPKTDLPEHLTLLRKGRCARLKEGSNTDQQIMPWYWDNEAFIALAPNISCYEAGKEYEHGGLSPQECIVPVITVSQQYGARSQPISIENVSWRGLRCTITVTGTTSGMKVDIRTKAGDPNTSLTKPKPPNSDGTVSILVEDDDRMGEAALIVILDSDGKPMKQIPTTIGG